jgi:hypothetical protein
MAIIFGFSAPCSSDPFVNFIPYRHARFESFPFKGGSFAANNDLLSLIQISLNLDFLQNIAPLWLTPFQ